MMRGRFARATSFAGHPEGAEDLARAPCARDESLRSKRRKRSKKNHAEKLGARSLTSRTPLPILPVRTRAKVNAKLRAPQARPEFTFGVGLLAA